LQDQWRQASKDQTIYGFSCSAHVTHVGTKEFIFENTQVNTYITPMSIKQISDSEFKTEVIDSSKPVLVDFWAEWCGPCKTLGPILEKLSSELEGQVEIKKINIDENPETPTNFGIRSIPTMILFKDGKILDSKIGVSGEEDIKNWISSKV